MWHRTIVFGFALICLAWGASISTAQEPIEIAKLQRTTPVSFEDEILPILQKNCLACHSASEAYGDLVLESPQTMLTGGDSGPAIVVGKGAESLLLKVAAHQEEPLMPPPDNDVAAANLTPAQLGLLKLWIDQGARSTGIGGLFSPTDWRPLPRGTQPIYAVAVTPDGQFAACGRANQIFIYHVPTGRLVTRLNDPELQAASKDQRPGIAHLDVIQSLAFNAQGNRLASGGFRTAKIWKYPRDVRRLELATTSEAVTAVAVSPDQAWIATATADHTIHLWNAVDGTPGAKLAGHTGSVTAIHFSQDGSQLYSASVDRSIRVWSVAEGVLVGSIIAPEAVNALTIALQPIESEGDAETTEPDAAAEIVATTIEQLVTGSGNAIQSWNIPQSLPQPLVSPLAAAVTVAISHDRQFLAMANAEGSIQVRRLESDEIIGTWQADIGAIHVMAFAPPPLPTAETAAETPAAEVTSPSDQAATLQLAIGGDTGEVQVWNVAAGEVAESFIGSASPISSLAYHPTSKQLAAGNATGEVTQWNLEAAEVTLWTMPSAAEIAVTSPDGKRLATVEGVDGKPAIVVRDVSSGNILATLLGHDGPITAIGFNATGTHLASASADKTARVWDLAEPRFPQTARFDEHADAATAVALNADATKVLSGAADGSLALWNTADATEPTTFAGHTEAITGVALLGGNQPVSASADKTVRFWNAADGKQTRAITETVAISGLVASNDSTNVAVAVGQETKLYQATDGKLLQTLAGNSAPIESLAFNADASRIVSVSAKEAVVSRVADGRLLEVVPSEEPITAGSIGGDGQSLYLATGEPNLAPKSLRFMHAFEGHTDQVTGLRYGGDGQMLLASSIDGNVRGFTVQTGQAAFTTNLAAAVVDMAISPDQQTLACAVGNKLRLLNATNGAALQPAEITATGGVVSVRFANEGSRIVASTGGDSPQTIVYVRATGAAEQILQEGILLADCVSLDQSRVIGLPAEGPATQWQLAGIQSFAGHTGPVTSLAHVTALQVISGSADGTLRHWDLMAATPQIRSINHGAPINYVAVHVGSERFASVSENNTVRLWNATNGQQLAEMKGDLRAKELVAKLNLNKADLTAKVAVAKTTLEAAQKEVPVKTEAEKTAATALAAAETDVKAKQAALTQTAVAKVNAEKSAIAAAATAQAAALKMREANSQAMQLTAQVARMTQEVTRAQSLAQSNPANEQLMVIAKEATDDLTTLQAEAKAAEAAKVQPTQQAATTAKAADDAAAQVVAMTKPYTDAATALAAAEDVLRIASGNHVIAERDLAAATAAVPVAEQELTAAEAALTAADAELAKAVAAEAAAQQPLRAAAFSPDGLTLATGGDFGVVHTWSAESGKEVSSYVGQAGSIQALAYLDSDTIVSAGSDTNAIVWSANPAWELERTIGSIADPTTLIDRVAAVAFNHKGDLLATGGGVPSRTGEIKIWNVADGTLHAAMPEAHTDGVNDLSFSADDTYLASAAADKLVKTWHAVDGEQVHQFEGHTEHALAVAWRSNGQMLASAGADATVRTWNAVNGDRIRTIAGYTKQVTDLRFVGQTQFVIAVSGDPLVRMHNSDNGGTQRNYGGASDYMYAVDVTPDSTIVVAGGHDGRLHVWNGANAQVLHTLAAPEVPTSE